jgi:hypothetical protein
MMDFTRYDGCSFLMAHQDPSGWNIVDTSGGDTSGGDNDKDKVVRAKCSVLVE